MAKRYDGPLIVGTTPINVYRSVGLDDNTSVNYLRVFNQDTGVTLMFCDGGAMPSATDGLPLIPNGLYTGRFSWAIKGFTVVAPAGTARIWVTLN